MKRFAVLTVVCCLLICRCCFGAENSSYLILKDRDANFLVQANEGATDTDMFYHFKQMLPGDTRRQIIYVQNQRNYDNKVQLFLQSVLHDSQTNFPQSFSPDFQTVSQMNLFLSKLHLKVWVQDRLIFNDTAEKPFLKPVYLGEIAGGQQFKITVDLTASPNLGNEMQSQIGEIDWQFTAEDRDEDFWQTGQRRYFPLVWAFLGACLLVIGVQILKEKASAKHTRNKK